MLRTCGYDPRSQTLSQEYCACYNVSIVSGPYDVCVCDMFTPWQLIWSGTCGSVCSPFLLVSRGPPWLFDLFGLSRTPLGSDPFGHSDVPKYFYIDHIAWFALSMCLRLIKQDHFRMPFWQNSGRIVPRRLVFSSGPGSAVLEMIGDGAGHAGWPLSGEPFQSWLVRKIVTSARSQCGTRSRPQIRDSIWPCSGSTRAGSRWWLLGRSTQRRSSSAEAGDGPTAPVPTVFAPFERGAEDLRREGGRVVYGFGGTIRTCRRSRSSATRP